MKKNIEIEWEPVGNLYDIYWDQEERLYYTRGPLLYCAFVKITVAFQGLLKAKHLRELRNELQGEEGTEDPARIQRLYTQLEEKKYGNEAFLLLYIGKVGSGEATILGRRLFESHDPATNCCTYALRASPEWIMVAVADCKKQVNDDKELELIETCEIFTHNPPLNLRRKKPDPIQIKQIMITNLWKSASKNFAPNMQNLLKIKVYP